MTEEKQKNDQRTVDWEFDFGNLGERVKEMFSSFGDELEDIEVETSEFNLEKANAQAALVDIRYGLAKAHVYALDKKSDLLIDATINHVGEVVFEAEGSDTKQISLKQKGKFNLSGNAIKRGFGMFSKRPALDWEIGLAPDVPINLALKCGVGSAEFNLSQLLLTDLEVDAGVGAVDLYLPVNSTDLDASIKTGVGHSKIYVPDQSDVSLKIKGGVGQVDIMVAPNAAIEIRAEIGIGTIQVPSWLDQVSKSKGFLNNNGTWRSDGYDLAEHKITIEYKGGVGQLSIIEAEYA